jgi:hypothetical protein
VQVEPRGGLPKSANRASPYCLARFVGVLPAPTPLAPALAQCVNDGFNTNAYGVGIDTLSPPDLIVDGGFEAVVSCN